MATFSTTALFAADRHEGPLSGNDEISFGEDKLFISTGEAGSSTTFSGNLKGKGAITIGGGDKMGGTLVFTGKYLPSAETVGDFTISNATLDLRGGGRLFADKFSRSHLTINTGGTLILENWGYGEGAKNLGGLGTNDGYFVLNGGTVRMTEDEGWSTSGSRPLLLGAGENTLSVDEGKVWVIAGKIYQSVDGRTLNKAGAGRLEFGRTVGYTGLTTISEGTLSLVAGKKKVDGSLVDDGQYGELKGGVLLSGAGTTLVGSGTETGGNIIGGAVTMAGANSTVSGDFAIKKSVTITGDEATLNGKMTIDESMTISGVRATLEGDFTIKKTLTITGDDAILSGKMRVGESVTGTVGESTGKSMLIQGANATLTGDLMVKGDFVGLGKLIVQKTNTSATSGASGATPAIISGKVVAGMLCIQNARPATSHGSGVSQLNIVAGADVEVYTIIVGYESIGGEASLNLTGGTVSVIQSDEVNYKPDIRIGDWSGGRGSLTVAGGTLDAESSMVILGRNGNGSYGGEENMNTFAVTNGVATVSGIDLGTKSPSNFGYGTSNLNVSGGTLKIGEKGIFQTIATGTEGRVVNINLGAGILGARANWSSSLAMKLGYMASEEASGNTMTTLNTAMGDAEEGYTVTLSGVLSDYSENQTGGLTKKGKGVLVLTAENTYKGNTVVGTGSLYLGAAQSLGSNDAAKLTLFGGTTLAANGEASVFSQLVSMGAQPDGGAEAVGGEVIHLGTADKTGKLTMNGAVTLQRSVGTLEVNADTTFAGAVESLSGKLIKEGSGALTFANSGTAINEIEIKAGTADFDSTESLVGVNVINLAAGVKLDLSGSSTAAGINFTGAAILAGASSYAGILRLGAVDGTAAWTAVADGDLKAGSVVLNNENVRLNVTNNGSFSTKSITFNLGFKNAAGSEDNFPPMITASSAEITGTEKGNFVLNFDALYIDKFIDQGGGEFRLFSTGVNYVYEAILNNHRQEISLDEQLLKETGRLVWAKIKLDASLIGGDEADSMNKYKSYTPQNGFIYLGAKEETVSIANDVVYNLNDEDEIITYKFTPGKGSLIYKGRLTGSEHKLDIIDYANITEKAEDHSAGYVALSNNANDFGKNTNITGTTVIVDLSLDKDQTLTGVNGNLNVNVLGTGDVTLVSSVVSQKGSTLCLRSYGEEKREGITTYTYDNKFILSEGSTLLQSGSNDQIITGALLSRAGDNTIANDGINSFILKGSITHEGNGSLTLRNEQASGNIRMDGSASQKDNPAILKSDRLNISGGTVHVINGYTVDARELTLTSGILSIEENGTFTAGQQGIKGGGTLHLNGGALKSASSWKSDVNISLGNADNTISSGGANVHLNKGVTGEGGFIKEGSGNLYLYNHAESNAKGVLTVKQGRLILLDKPQEKGRSVAETSAGEYKLNGNLVLSNKGASLEGMIDANNHNVIFGDNTNFYLGVSESKGLTGYIHNASTITIGTGTRLHIDVLDDSWVTEKNYTIFSANDSIQGGNNLELTSESEYQFVDVSLTYAGNKEIGLILGKKGNGQGGQTSDGTNKGEINAVVAPLVSEVLSDSSKLTGKLLKTIQTVSKMTTTEYQTYLGDMGNSASSFYTALSAQVQDTTLHLNSVRNRVGLLNPVMYDDWQDGGIYNMWVGGINHYRDVKSGEEAPGYKMTSWGGELGCAVPLSESFLIGMGFAYTSTEVNVKDNWGDNESDTYNVDLFARYRKELWTLTAVLSGGFSNVDFHRNQLVKDELTRSNSSSDGNQFMGTFEAMYDVYLNEEKSWILQPLVNLTAGRAKLDGLSETGELKNAGLIIGSQSYNMFSAGVGAKIAYEYKTDVSDLPGRVELKAMYVNDMGDVDFKVNGRFIGVPEKSFNLSGVSNERSAVVVSAGWVAPVSSYGQFFADASCEFRKDQTGVSSTVGFSFQF